MINVCPRCGKLMEEGQDILMQIIGKYHTIQSTNCFALGRDVEMVPGTMEHLNCVYGHEGD